jgi:type II secretory pathway predicted ATPase ExeA
MDKFPSLSQFRKLPSQSSLLTYEPYFGLREKAFSLSADPKFLYKSPSHTAAFDDLLVGIRRREGLIVLTGDIGAGKTTLCRAVLEQLDRKTFSTFVPDPFVSREDLLRMLLIDFGVMSVDDLKGGRLDGASRPDLSYPLYEFLKSLLPLQAFAVLILDEAQNLSPLLLEEIRILSDLEAPEKLLQVVLVGQLEFRAKLKLPEMRQLDQRVSVRCRLEPLSLAEVDSYIKHRLHVAGGEPDRIRFSTAAVDAIFQASGGVPRLINLIADRALYKGYVARSAEIDRETVSYAVADLGVGELTAPGTYTPRAHLGDRDFTGQHEDSQVPVRGSVVRTDVGGEPFSPSSIEESPAERPDVPQATHIVGGESVAGGRWLRSGRVVKTATLIGMAALLMLLVRAGFMYTYPEGDQETLHVPPPPAQESFGSAVPAGPPQDTPYASPDVADADAKPYAIDVALFQSADRADRLVTQLVAAGYSAYRMDLTLESRGRSYIVLVGNYAERAHAEPDLARIRKMPSYGDAAVMIAPSKKSLPQ